MSVRFEVVLKRLGDKLIEVGLSNGEKFSGRIVTVDGETCTLGPGSGESTPNVILTTAIVRYRVLE